MKRFTNLLGLLTRPKPLVGQTPADVAWEENKWKLLHYRARPQGLAFKTPVLLVPSLINRHYVLDLMPGKSFTEYLVAQGFDVFCIDWGTPGDEDRYVTFDDVVERWLGRAIRRVAGTVAHQKAHVLGYCMGGTLAAIHGAVHPEHFASFIGLAAPVKFHDDSLLSRWTNSRGFEVDPLVDGFGNIPWQLLQSAFQMLRPTLNLSKAVTLLDRAWNDEFLDGFLAMEQWGNDNVSLPGEFYRRYIAGLYQQEGLLSGRFSLAGRPVQLEKITFPTLAVTFEHDNIVPAESARVLLDKISSSQKQQLHLPGGHVGAVVSKHAGKTLWPAVVEFFARYDAPPGKIVEAPVVVAPVVTAAPVPVEAPSKPSPKPAPKPRASPGRPRRTPARKRAGGGGTVSHRINLR